MSSLHFYSMCSCCCSDTVGAWSLRKSRLRPFYLSLNTDASLLLLAFQASSLRGFLLVEARPAILWLESMADLLPVVLSLFYVLKRVRVSSSEAASFLPRVREDEPDMHDSCLDSCLLLILATG